MVEKMYINPKRFEELCDKLIKGINKKKYDYVYGVPRGGTLVALYVHLKTGIPLISVPAFERTLVVDDLIDSGRTMEQYVPNHDFKVLIDKRKMKEKKWIEFFYEDTESDSIGLVTRQLEFIGENPLREGLKDTPGRVIRMWVDFFKGYNPKNKPHITSFNNGSDGVVYDEMIVDKGDFYSYCEHHVVPFFGNYCFAYIPNKKLVGLSKIARLVEFHSSKLQIQERIAKEVLDDVVKEIKPKGCALVLRGRHLCKEMRGIKKKGEMVTSDLRGVFKTQSKTREEFMAFVNSG